jgi:hypothetical protein
MIRIAVVIALMGTSALPVSMAQPARPHSQLETPLIGNGNWPWWMTEDVLRDFPYRANGGHPELLRGTYVELSSTDERYAAGINFHAEFLAKRARDAATQSAKLWGLMPVIQPIIHNP